jgi:predicted nucleic acid-binding protein
VILLDSNVISESMRIAPDRRVMSWLDRHPASSLFLCAITVDEITFGIEVLPSGRKRTRLAAVFSRIIDLFSGRIIAFDTRAATESAKFRGQRRLAGSPMSLGDSQIAGVAKSRGYALATLNARDFRDIDLSVLEPR